MEKDKDLLAMDKMVDNEKAPLLKWFHHMNAQPTTKVWENDVEMTGLHRKSKGFSHYVKRTLPWLGFGVLCVLLGGLFVHMYFNKHINERELHQSRNQYMQDEAYVRSLNEQVPVSSHVTKENDQSELIDVVKAVLQNANHDKETEYTNDKREDKLREDHQKKLNFTMGKVTDNMLQDCGDVRPDKVFPDIDYALYGYDSLKGYPLAIGHDPGYTLPIFKADYTTESQSGDCRYNVPEGLAVVPDISCVTSFSSKTVKTHNEFMNSLAVSAGVEAGGWGMSFSMSASYKTMSSQLENEEKVFIMSNAECKYYFCKIESTSPPGFTDGFMKWVKKLNKSSLDIIDIMEFFDKYGTHFIVESDFGARYTYQYSMTSKELEKKKEQHVNVEMSASYSGLFSLGATFGLDSDQTSMAQDFMKDIDTKTYTVGAAPPAGGDAMEWASTVATDPVPVHYKLDSIENLFTETYMSKLTDINYNKIYGDIVRNKHKYQRYLKYKALYGDSRAREHNYVPFFNSTLRNYAYQELGVMLSDCVDDCINDPKCIAFSRQSNLCNFYHGEGPDNHLAAGDRGQSYTTYMLWKKGNETFRLDDTIFGGTVMRSIEGISQADCEQKCFLHERCFGITYQSKSCKMFQQFQITRLISDTVSHAKSVVVPATPSPELYLGYSL